MRAFDALQSMLVTPFDFELAIAYRTKGPLFTTAHHVVPLRGRQEQIATLAWTPPEVRGQAGQASPPSGFLRFAQDRPRPEERRIFDNDRGPYCSIG